MEKSIENSFVGREDEAKILQKALISGQSEMISVTGRRRVGKTYMIRSVYKQVLDFEFIGSQNTPRPQQLESFAEELKRQSRSSFKFKTPKNWSEAFRLLITFLKRKRSKRKKVIFLDEVPWMASSRSGFLGALGYFWNSWASQNRIVLVLCGSASSWMIEKLEKDKGGLHNRLTRRIRLSPFTLNEAEAFLKSKNINLGRYQIVQLYMVMGGIPHYLNEIEGGKSAVQVINEVCFSKNGLLRTEFSNLLPSLFDRPNNYIAIVKALAETRKGLTRQEILKAGKFTEGGGVSKVLRNLDDSGFITAYQPFGKKKKQTLYRLTDEYCLFYLKFIEPHTVSKREVWQKLSKTPKYKSWSGYSFESLCLKHISQIEKGLGISGIDNSYSSYIYPGTAHTDGFQIDLLIDRPDQVINLCEIKFYKGEYVIDKAEAMTLRNRMANFKRATKTKKHLFLTVITTFGLVTNEYSLELADQELTMDVLFEPN